MIGCTFCRGVVQLFNAITTAQKARRDAELSGAKGKEVIKDSKAALLQALQPKAAAPAPGWKVLQEGYTGHEGNTKLKDRDREAVVEEDMHGELEDLEASDEDYADY